MKTKSEVRKLIKQKRNNLSKFEIIQLSSIIVKNFLERPEVKSAKVIMSYMDIKNEVETSFLNSELLKLGKILVLPRIINDEISPVLSSNEFSIGQFGVKEPLGEVYEGPIDLIIIPGIAFNMIGDRIGFGKGYYDRFLSNSLYENTTKISLGYNFQINSDFKGENFDKKIDILITETKILNYKLLKNYF